MAGEVLYGHKRRGFHAALDVLKSYVRNPLASSLAEAEKAVEYLDAADVVRVGVAQEILGVKSPTTIKKWIALGRFPGSVQSAGGQWLIPTHRVYALRDASLQAKNLNAQSAPVVVPVYDGDPYEDLGRELG